ncbi:MAG TPA: long-chain fatty acid--CoA ligase [Steroidobacteraceae bacterium]|nr:long-chain fatty acid--CoA ligase [Steroidobacteraceae bacterium]
MSHAANRPKASPADGYPWEKNYSPGVRWDFPLPKAQPLAHFLVDAAANWPDRIGLDFYDRQFTYAELLALAQRAANGLQAIGVGPGVNVGLHLINSPHYIVCLFGIVLAGGRVVNFSPLAARRELEYQLADSQTEVMITVGVPSLYGVVAGLKGKGRLRKIVVCALEDFLAPELARVLVGPPAPRTVDSQTEIDFRALIANDGKFAPHALGPLDEEVAVLQYTGGTTGEPKGAMLTHANFSSVLDIYQHWRGNETVDATEKGLLVLPLFHIFGLTSALLGSLQCGLQIVLLLRFDPDRVLSDISTKRITRFSGVPTMYAGMINHPRIKEFDLSSLKRCGSGGAPLPADVAQRFRALTGISPKEGYGLTETAPLATLQRHEGETRTGTVGMPAPHSLIEIVSLEDGKTVLPIGQHGEICITGPQIMKGYWNKPAATADALRDGRFHSGDIGFLDSDGYVTLVDRKKDMILSGGFNVFPRTIEEAIYEHPTVAECTVIGVPDAHRGQSAKAFIALKPDSKAFSFEELLAFLRDKLAKYELPAEMEIRDSLPKTGVGKLSKKELVAEELAKRAAKAS